MLSPRISTKQQRNIWPIWLIFQGCGDGWCAHIWQPDPHPPTHTHPTPPHTHTHPTPPHPRLLPSWKLGSVHAMLCVAIAPYHTKSYCARQAITRSICRMAADALIRQNISLCVWHSGKQPLLRHTSIPSQEHTTSNWLVKLQCWISAPRPHCRFAPGISIPSWSWIHAIRHDCA